MREVIGRAEKAQATRERLLARAGELFLAQGFAATSTRQIAEAAQVTERTLFNIVPNKSELLRQVVLTAVVGDPPRPLLRRDDFRASVEASSLEESLDAFVAAVAALHERSSALAEVVRQAAAVDPGAAEFWAWGNAQQVADCRVLIRQVRRRGWLSSRQKPTRLADSLAVLSGHETYYRLVHERGWSADAYRRWLARHCSAELTG